MNGLRANQDHPRARGTNPRAKGTNPRRTDPDKLARAARHRLDAHYRAEAYAKRQRRWEREHARGAATVAGLLEREQVADLLAELSGALADARVTRGPDLD